MLSLGGLKATISFALNKAYIIKELCVQKDEAVNTCQGQCHLKKSIKKQTEDEGNLAITFEAQLAPFIRSNSQDRASSGHPIEVAGEYAPLLISKTVKYTRSCLHPPCSQA